MHPFWGCTSTSTSVACTSTPVHQSAHEKFVVPSFINSKDMIKKIFNGSRDPDHAN